MSGHRSPPHISAALGIQLSRCMLGTDVRLIDFLYNSNLIVLSCFYMLYLQKTDQNDRFYRTYNSCLTSFYAL